MGCRLRAPSCLAWLMLLGPLAPGISAHDYAPGDKVMIVETTTAEPVGGLSTDFLPGVEMDFEAPKEAWLARGVVLTVRVVEEARLLTTPGPYWVDSSQVVPLSHAIEHFSALIAKDPGNWELHTARAAAWGELGDARRTIEDLTEAMRLAADPPPLMQLARAKWLQTIGEHERALADIAAVAGPSEYQMSVLKARCESMLALGRHREALNDCEELLSIDPSCVGVRTMRARAWEGLGKAEKAAEDDAAAALETDPRSEFHLDDGIRLCLIGFYDLAIDDFDTAIQLNAANGRAYLCRGAAFYALGNRDKAYADFDAADEHRPANRVDYLKRAWHWIEREMPDNAIADLTHVIRTGRKESEYYRVRGDAWHLKGDHARALADYLFALERDPENIRVYFSQSQVYHSLGRNKQAIGALDELLAISPDDHGSRFHRGMFKCFLGDFAGAEEDITEAIRLAPHEMTYLIGRSEVRLHFGDADGALSDVNEALRIGPPKSEAYDVRANAWFALEDYEKALRDYDEALRLGRVGRTSFNHPVCATLARRSDAASLFNAFVEFSRWQDDRTDEAAILGYFAARREKDDPAAQTFLKALTENVAEGWPLPVVRFLREEVSETKLLALTSDDAQRGEAYCYLGMWHALNNRNEEARQNLLRAKDDLVEPSLHKTLVDEELRLLDNASRDQATPTGE